MSMFIEFTKSKGTYIALLIILFDSPISVKKA